MVPAHTSLVGGARGRSPAGAPARRAGGFPGGDAEPPSDDDKLSPSDGEDDVSMQTDAHMRIINVQQGVHVDVQMDNRVLHQQNTVNVQQNYGVDGAVLMGSVNAFVGQSEANTRDRIDQASQVTAAMVVNEAEMRHTQAIGEVHTYYTRVFQELESRYQSKVEEIRVAAIDETSQVARKNSRTMAEITCRK